MNQPTDSVIRTIHLVLLPYTTLQNFLCCNEVHDHSVRQFYTAADSNNGHIHNWTENFSA